MKNNIFISLAITVASLSVINPATAIVTNNYTIAEADPANIYSNFNWDGVYRVSGGTAVAVGAHWLLTANHVKGTTLYYDNGSTTSIAQSISHPTADLKLLRVNDSFNTHYSIFDGSYTFFPNNQKTTSILTGYGYKGNESSIDYTNEYYNWDDTTSSEVKRWGTSTMDAAYSNVTYNESYVGDLLYLQFNFNTNQDTPYEAGGALRDSGGGMFVEDNGTWYLAATTATLSGVTG